MSPRLKSALIAGSAAAVFLAVEWTLFFHADIPVAEAMRALSDTHPAFVGFFRHITDLGKSAWYLWPCGLATLFGGFISRGKSVPPRWKRLTAYVGVRAMFLFMTIGISGLIADAIKPLLGRARPVEWFQHALYGFSPLTALGSRFNSMPSGHTTTAFALAASLSVLYPRLRPLWFAYAFALAASRVIVTAHYLSDVCAGAVLGYLTVRWTFKHGIFQVWKVIFPIDVPPAAR